MRPLRVVVVDVDAEHMLEVATVEDQQPVQISERMVLTKRSAIAFAFGARTGVFTIRMPSLRKTSSKGPLYLLSRSRIKKRTPCLEKSRPRLRACWLTQAPVGLAVQPASQMRRLAWADEEEDVVPTQKHRFDGEEIAGDDDRRLGAEKLARRVRKLVCGSLERSVR
jgi:hypothetical protein